jgi:hypothetical protein
MDASFHHWRYVGAVTRYCSRLSLARKGRPGALPCQRLLGAKVPIAQCDVPKLGRSHRAFALSLTPGLAAVGDAPRQAHARLIGAQNCTLLNPVCKLGGKLEYVTVARLVAPDMKAAAILRTRRPGSLNLRQRRQSANGRTNRRATTRAPEGRQKWRPFCVSAGESFGLPWLRRQKPARQSEGRRNHGREKWRISCINLRILPNPGRRRLKIHRIE